MVIERLRMVCLAGVLALPAQAQAPDTRAPDRPARVVSINLCTDQLAMMLADQGQLLSVTYMARDPRASVMSAQARAYPSNHGLAEEVYLLHPDLVLAGRFTGRATVEMLRRLGVRVVIFEPAHSLADVRQGMLDMGAALGQEPRAAQMAARYDAALTAARAEARHSAAGLTAATYAANGYSAGDRSLSGEIITAAGYTHLAAQFGLRDGGLLPLETLVMAAPDLVIRGSDYAGAAHAEEVLDHPAFRALNGASTQMQDRDWVCGLPSVLDAVAQLSAQRRHPAGDN